MVMPAFDYCGAYGVFHSRVQRWNVKKKVASFFLIVMLFIAGVPAAEATFPTFDAVNATLSELRNSLMQSQFAQSIALAIEQFNQIKAQYLELMRFNSGWDELIRDFVGDPLKDAFGGGYGSASAAFSDFGSISSDIENLESAEGARDIRASLEAITGRIPVSDARPYIPFEEKQVVDAFDFAREIRLAGEKTRETANSISDQASNASPKGVARLQAQALSHIVVLNQQNQEAVAKLLELEATQIEQVSREEKKLEWERIKFMEDAKDYLQSVLNGV